MLRDNLLHQPVPADVEDGLRDYNGAAGDDIPLLQRLPQPDRGRLLLAAHGVLPSGDVHRQEEDEEVLVHLDVAQDPELGLPGGVARCGS